MLAMCIGRSEYFGGGDYHCSLDLIEMMLLLGRAKFFGPIALSQHPIHDFQDHGCTSSFRQDSLKT